MDGTSGDCLFCPCSIAFKEADEKTAAYLFVTPLGRSGYLAARLCIPSAIAFLVTIALLPVFRLTSISPGGIVLLAAGGALQGTVNSLLIVTFSSNKLEGMAVSKLSGLMIFGAAIPFFIKHDVQYVLSWLPSFWIGKAICENISFYMLPAFALLITWIYILFFLYNKCRHGYFTAFGRLAFFVSLLKAKFTKN